MQRVQIYLTETQLKTLEEEQRKTGLSRSELIRRILDKELQGSERINETSN